MMSETYKTDKWLTDPPSLMDMAIAVLIKLSTCQTALRNFLPLPKSTRVVPSVRMLLQIVWIEFLEIRKTWLCTSLFASAQQHAVSATNQSRHCSISTISPCSDAQEHLLQGRLYSNHIGEAQVEAIDGNLIADLVLASKIHWNCQSMSKLG